MSASVPVAAEAGATPLTARDFAALLDPLLKSERPKPKIIALAVSGGADSMALALLAKAWARKRGIKLQAFTVDHGLRSEAAAEARQVVAWLAAAGVPCRILRWRGAKPKAGVQDAARTARYRLLAEACASEGARHLLLAHHRDDQAETVFMRLLRGSGVDGLAAMAAVTERNGLTLLRPLLACPKARLIATLRKAGQDWIEDPSNGNDAFQRVRVRHVLKDLGAEILGDSDLLLQRLAMTAKHMARAREVLEQATASFLAVHGHANAYGFATVDRTAFLALDEETALRVMVRMVQLVGGSLYAPRLEQSLRLCNLARDGGIANLSGCRIEAHAAIMRFSRDYGRDFPEAQPLHSLSALWDGRLSVNIPAAKRNERRFRALSVLPLGRIPARDLPRHLAVLRAHDRAGVPILRDNSGNSHFPVAHDRRLYWPELYNIFMEFRGLAVGSAR